MRLIIVSVVTVVVILGGFVGYKAYETGRESREARGSLEEMIRGMGTYAEYGDRLLVMLGEHHAEAFASAYEGGMLSQAMFDEEAYHRELIRLMLAGAESRGSGEDRLAAADLGTRLAVIQVRPGEGMEIPGGFRKPSAAEGGG